MKFRMVHTNINVIDMEKSLEFYDKALGLKTARRFRPEDGSFELAYISDGSTEYQIELTWLRDKDTPYELGDNETHIAFTVDDFGAARALHDAMGCVCYDNPAMGIYFIEDPDGYWLEIIPKRD